MKLEATAAAAALVWYGEGALDVVAVILLLVGCRGDEELEVEDAAGVLAFIQGWLRTCSMDGRSWGLNESIHLISDWASVPQRWWRRNREGDGGGEALQLVTY